MANRSRELKAYMDRRLERYQNASDRSYVRAQLAMLRRGVGKKPGALPELWGILFGDLPEEFLSVSGEPTREEWAVYTALTLYALHQQGSEATGPEGCMHRPGRRLGAAARQLVTVEEEEERIARRLQMAATANGIAEAAQHLRGLVRLLRGGKIPLDYAQLAADLYNFQFPDGAARVRLAWGQDFYRQIRQTKEERMEQTYA